MVESARHAAAELREEPVPHRLAGAVARGPLIEATSEVVLIRVPMVGRFLVRAEGPALVERAPGATSADLRCFLDEPVTAAAAFLRGALVLRAAAVSVGGRAVVLCGTSGAGKSALAAALAQRGHAVLADAVTVIAGGPDASPSVAPVAPEPLLWPDTAEELGLTRRESRLVRPALAKRAYALGAAPEAAPVAAVVVIQADAIRTEPELAPVVGGEKVESLLRSRWLGRLAEPLGLEPVQFLVATRVAAACSCARLVRPRAGAPVSALAALVEGLAA